MYNSKYIKTLKTTNTNQHWYSKCPQSPQRHVENAEAMEVEAEVEAKGVDAVHPTTNYHSASARNRSTSLSSSAPSIAAAGSIAPFPSCAAPIAPYTLYRPPRAVFALIRSMHAPNLECPPHQH